MKKITLIASFGAAFALCALLMAGCTAGSNAASNTATNNAAANTSSSSTTNGLTVSKADTAASLEETGMVFCKGSDIVVELSANSTTGYQWTVKIDGDSVKQTYENYASSATSNTAAGAGGVQRYEFKGVKAGEATISLTYARSWETSDSDLHYQAVITTNGSGEVTKLAAGAVRPS